MVVVFILGISWSNLVTASHVSLPRLWMVIYKALNTLTIEHMQRKRKSRKGGSYSTLSLLRKELREGNLQSLFGGSSCIVSSSNVAADPLLSSFILPVADELASCQPQFPTESRSTKKISDETVSKR